MEQVVLVNQLDEIIGSEEKMRAHRTGQLHRAFSIFLFDEAGRVLLQRRATGKYHSAGLWSNTCCGHPRPGEPLLEAACRRLNEEMGIACDLGSVASFTYRAMLDHDLIEHEIDHVFVGEATVCPNPDPAEIDAWKWSDISWLRRQVVDNSQCYTAWLPLCLGVLPQAKP